MTAVGTQQRHQVMADDRAQGKTSSEQPQHTESRKTVPALEHNREQPGMKVEGVWGTSEEPRTIKESKWK